MRIFKITVVLLLLFTKSVMAISPITMSVVHEAQEYGINQANKITDEFFAAWTVYEEKVVKLNPTAEKACIYTPYLLLALDAREKFLKGDKVRLLDSKQVLSSYAGTLVFSAVLFGNTVDFTDGLMVVLRQNKKIIKAYQIIYPKATKIKQFGKDILYTKSCYFYFKERDVALEKPVTLTIYGKNKPRNFYFNLPRFK